MLELGEKLSVTSSRQRTQLLDREAETSLSALWQMPAFIAEEAEGSANQESHTYKPECFYPEGEQKSWERPIIMTQVKKTCPRLTLDHKIWETSLAPTMCPIPYIKYHPYTIEGGRNDLKKIPSAVQWCKVCWNLRVEQECKENLTNILGSRLNKR